MVCNECWEPKHEQLMIKVPEERIAPPWKAPEPVDTFVSLPEALFTDDGTLSDPTTWLLTSTGLAITTEN